MRTPLVTQQPQGGLYTYLAKGRHIAFRFGGFSDGLHPPHFCIARSLGKHLAHKVKSTTNIGVGIQFLFNSLSCVIDSRTA